MRSTQETGGRGVGDHAGDLEKRGGRYVELYSKGTAGTEKMAVVYVDDLVIEIR